jgi:nicotinamidase-related amidase
MTSQPVRNPATDHLLTPQNSALIVIDYQPVQVTSVASMDRRALVDNIVSVAKGARLFGLPIVLSTVNVKTGRGAPTIHQLKEVLPDAEELDRTTINAWEDEAFVAAVKATGRKKLIMTALWTEACLTFPALDALREGYEVYPVIDAVGGTSVDAHRGAIERMVQAGAKPVSWVQMMCELQRDWNRTATAARFAEILFTVEGHKIALGALVSALRQQSFPVRRDTILPDLRPLLHGLRQAEVEQREGFCARVLAAGHHQQRRLDASKLRQIPFVRFALGLNEKSVEMRQCQAGLPGLCQDLTH